jgi:hypothetical protein
MSADRRNWRLEPKPSLPVLAGYGPAYVSAEITPYRYAVPLFPTADNHRQVLVFTDAVGSTWT